MTGNSRPFLCDQSFFRLVKRLLEILLPAFSLFLPVPLLANPSGVISSQGISSIQGIGTGKVTIQQSAPKAIINWRTFNIASGQITQFIQPSSQSIALNRIFDSNPSQIFGSLIANGSVILLNPNGVFFGKGSQVNVNGLVASTLSLSDSNFLSGNFRYQGNGGNSSIINEGTIQSSNGGYVYLFAPSIQNNGLIESPEGQIFLGAGQSVYLANSPDGNGFLVQITAPQGSVVNLSRLIANGGQINLFGAAVSQQGLIRADAVRNQNGVIELYASKSLELAAGSVTEANGGDGIGQGGSVRAISDKTSGETLFDPGALVDISGGKLGGNGGSAEISGAMLQADGSVIGTAVKGYKGGALLFDPTILNLTGSDFLKFYYGGLDSVTYSADDINITNAQVDFGTWAATSPSLSPSLIFQATNDINFNNVTFTDTLLPGSGIKWNFSATAGHDIIFNQSVIHPTNGGTITLSAGNNIQLQSGNGVYSYLWTEGGDIHLTAGGNLVAPTYYDSSIYQVYSGIRLDAGPNGEQANLYVTLGGDFLGGVIDGINAPPGFILSNGTANIDLSNGGNFGSTNEYGVITLAKGIINITADKNIYLGNVQDEGAIEQGYVTADPSDQVNLISLTGDIHLKPSNSQYVIPNSPNLIVGQTAAIYPATFTANAPSGNIFFDAATIEFWPSPQGAITFHAYGNIEGTVTNGLTGIWVANLDPSEVLGVPVGQIWQEHPFLDPTVTAGAGVNLQEANVPAPVLFKTDTGNIANLNFHFLNPILQKNVSISAGLDLTNFIAEIGVPDQTSQGFVTAGRDIIFAAQSPGIPFSGISFVGEGTGFIQAGRNMDLGTSNGIEDHISNNVFTEFGSGYPGLIDISVGGAILMTKSKIWSYNGASIDIHGLNGSNSPVGIYTKPLFDANGNPILDQNGNQETENVSVDVGTSAGFGNDLGIVTLRGGNINIYASGDVNVNAARVATIGSGNININTIGGSINAGIGSPDALVDFSFPVSYDLVNNRFIYDSVKVPGSGIFTFDKDDPDPIPPYPPANPFLVPLLLGNSPLKSEDEVIIEQEQLGHDVTALVAKYLPQIMPQLNTLYDQVKANFSSSWKLGNITLQATDSIIIPPAGIRGKKVIINAPNLSLQGGTLVGDVDLVGVQTISGNISAIQGPVSGTVGGVSVSASSPLGGSVSASSSLGSMSGSTGGVSTQVASSNTAASVQASKTDTNIASDSDNNDSQSSNNSPSSSRSSKKKGGGKRFVLKQGVVIEVDTEEEKGNDE